MSKTNKIIQRIKILIKQAEDRGENMDDISWGMQEGILISYNEAKEIIALKEWKDSAIEIFKEIDLQEVGKEMGLAPGASISKNILPFIRKLKCDNNKNNAGNPLPTQII